MALNKLLNLIDSNSYMNVSTMIFYLGITLVLTTAVFLIYKMTFTGIAYSNNFNVSIVLTGLITAMIMMVIGNNLALSLGMVGALSIVRFRSAIKEPKDISFLFWAIAIGLSAGTGAIQIAIVGTLFIGLTVFLYYILPSNNKAYLLIVKGGIYDSCELENVISKHTKKLRLRIKNSKMETTESIYEIRLKKDEHEMLKELKSLESVNHVNLVVFEGHLNE